jgi:hypothetical protein
MAQNTTISAASLQSLREGMAFTDGYNGTVGASDATILKVVALQTNLNNYSKMLSSLATAYAALNSESTYNGSGNFNTAIRTLATDVNAFATGAGAKTAPLPAAASAIVGEVGGQIISMVQAAHVKADSQRIAIQLDQIIKILQEDDMRDKVVPSEILLMNDTTAAAQILYDSGVYSYTPIANQLGAPLGLTATSTADATIQDKSKCLPHACMLNGFHNVEAEYAKMQAESIGASYDASFKALQNLQALHQKLQTGQPIDASAITSDIAQLQSIATSLKTAITPSAATKTGK